MQDRLLGGTAGLPLPFRHHLFDDRVLSLPGPSRSAIVSSETFALPERMAAGSRSGYELGVAGLVIGVETDRPGAGLECAPGSRPFLVSGRPADLQLEVDWQELDERPQGRPLFDSGGVWRAFQADTETILRFHDASAGTFPYKEARLEAGTARGRVLLDPRALPADRAVDPLEYPLDELLFQRLLAARAGLELHAVGVVTPSGRGCLFAGQSGDGKTTTARLWQQVPGATILSDDRIVLTRDGEGWRMHGTPWHGEAELALAASAPLDGVFVLARGEQSRLVPMSAAAAVAALLARSFPPFHDQAATAQLVQRLETLVLEAGCHLFPFVPDASAVRRVLDLAP